ALQHFVQQRDRDSRARATNGMPDRNRSAVYIEPVAAEIQFAVAGEHLGGEGFIQFDQSEIVQLEVVLLFELAQSRYRTNPQGARVDSRRGHGRDSRQ